MRPDPRIIVTLVHGTVLFARWPFVMRLMRVFRGARPRPAAKLLWHHSDSLFATSLKNALGEDRTAIRSFDWMGGNSVFDRLSAAGSLRQHLAEIADKHPAAVQVLVGHSHGGSVCLAALHDDQTRQQVKAFVSLATPYVHVRQRWDSQKVETALRVLGFALFTAVMLTVMWWLEPRVGEFWNAAVFTLAMFVVMAVVLKVLSGRRARIETVRAWAQSVNEDEQEMPARLIVISDGDEALLVLKIAEALSAISRGLWRAAYGVVELVGRGLETSRRRAWILYGGVAVAFLIWFLVSDPSSPWGPVAGVPWTLWFPVKMTLTAAIAPAFLFMAVAIALFVPTLAAMLLGFPPLVFFRWLAFGWGGSPGVDVTAESLPLGNVTAVRLPAPTGGRGLRHSELYHDPRVPPLIAEFIQRTVDADGAPSKKGGPGLV